MYHLIRESRWIRRGLLPVLALMVGIGYAVTRAEAQKEKPPMVDKKFMAEKLANAQLILQGLAMGDFDLIKKSAGTLVTLSKKAEWIVVKTDRYDVFSNDFRRSLETIQEKCKDKNLDGATLAFVEMTMACVKCHKYCRDEARISIPLNDGVNALTSTP